MLVPDSSQLGKSGKCGSMSALTSRLHREGHPRGELPLDQPTGYLSNKFKNGQQFFTRRANY